MTQSKTQSDLIHPLVEADRSQWVVAGRQDRIDRITCWGSDQFTVQIFRVDGGVIRLAINRTELSYDHKVFKDGISWEQLMQIKNQVGYGDYEAIEVYPPDRHVVNKINTRHLWVLPHPMPFSWQMDGDKILNFLD